MDQEEQYKTEVEDLLEELLWEEIQADSLDDIPNVVKDVRTLEVKIFWKDKPSETIEATRSWRHDGVIFVIRADNGLTRKIPEQAINSYTTKEKQHEEAK